MSVRIIADDDEGGGYLDSSRSSRIAEAIGSRRRRRLQPIGNVHPRFPDDKGEVTL